MKNKRVLYLFLVLFSTMVNGTELISISSSQASANDESSAAAFTSDGRFVVFESAATNLVPNDTNAKRDIFLRDRLHHTTVRVSVSTSGTEANDNSSSPSISKDGKLVVFSSSADNLVTGGRRGGQVYLRNLETNETRCISVNAAGEMGNFSSGAPMISADGRYVVFMSSASNLVSNDNNDKMDIFLCDLQSHTIELVSISSNGEQADNFSYSAAIDGNGSHIVFASHATNLVANDYNGASDVFLRDIQKHTTVRLSVSSDNSEADYASGSPSISEDGRYVVFDSSASNLVANDTNEKKDIFLRDIENNTTKRLSISSTSEQANDSSYFPHISGDGAYVVFDSYASNLVPALGTTPYSQVYIHGVESGRTACISKNLSGEYSGGISEWSFIGSGEYVSFQSYASDIVSNDTNGKRDIFLADNPYMQTTAFLPAVILYLLN